MSGEKTSRKKEKTERNLDVRTKKIIVKTTLGGNIDVEAKKTPVDNFLNCTSDLHCETTLNEIIRTVS